MAALIVLALLSVLLTRPLSRLTEEMDAAASLSFDKREADISLFSEFYKLNESFLKLSTGIEAMTKYVPMPVVSQIMSRSMKSDLRESGFVSVAMKRVTIMFCDIRGFTTLSEKLDTTVVVRMLFEWLGAYTKVIVNNGGVVDKYVGDLYVRVGIHTGELYVGNIGCEEHINYTVCGTPANIAARIEQLGKVYGLTPLVSGDVAKAVEDQCVCVWLDELKLRGHESTLTKVYHLAAHSSEASPDLVVAAQTMSVIQALHSDPKSGPAGAKGQVMEALSNPCLRKYHVPLAFLLGKIESHQEVDVGILNH
eukprot:m51a1_g13552 hypothetical protein (309) ;mRNA; f:290-1397